MNLMAQDSLADLTEADLTEANLSEVDMMVAGLTAADVMADNATAVAPMEDDMTLGDVYDGIADRLAEARTRALMGERQEALGLMHAASLEYTRFRDALKAFPGHHALDYAFTVTMAQLCAEQDRAYDPETSVQPKAKSRSRRKSERAA